MISQVIVLLLTLTSAFAKQQEDCKHGKNKSEDNFVVLVLILGTIYLLNAHKVGQNVQEQEEEEGSSDEDESDYDQAQEESANSASEMEDESNDDDDGDNGNTSEEEGDESEEEVDGDGEPSSGMRKRRSSRLGSKAMGYDSRE